MNIFKEFEIRVVETIEKMGLSSPSGQPIVFDRVKAEPPREPVHGDIATNAAMVLAKQLGTNPRDLAEHICTELAADPDIEAVSVAGPGFINMKLSPAFWQRVLRDVVVTGEDYGKLGLGNHSKINVEYVSANPTGPMHVGHCRGAVVGDSLANLLEFAGYDVTREYYINDAGAQIDKLAQSVFLRYREALGEAIGPMPEGLYPGEYLKPVGQALVDEFGPGLRDRPESDWMPVIKDRTIDAMMDMIREDLAALNIEHDVFFSERTLHEKGEKAIREAINDLTFKGYVYQGKLPPPKGQVPEDWEDREQTLFNSTEVGDDIDRPLIKSDGSYTYFAADVAYFRNKYERGFAEMIYVLGADHGGYVKRLEAVAKAVSAGKAKLTVLLCQLVKLFRDGEPVRMSKRSGEFVTLRDVVDEVGRDPVRFMMLYRKNSEPLDFDFAKVTEQTKDNPVFYVQYAHARCYSVFRQAQEVFPDTDIDGCDYASVIGDYIRDQGELQLVAKLAEFPRIVESAALAHEPHRIAYYLYDLAGAFHSHWNRGREQLRFINHKNRELTLARLALVKAVATVLKSGLRITGTDAPTEMR